MAAAAQRVAERATGPLAELLHEHALEEHEHVTLWLRFARAAGWSGGEAWHYSEDPLEQTVACARVWTGGQERPLAEHLVTMYAVESVQPEISRAKVKALLDHYGFEEGLATEYFHVHARRDQEYAAVARAALDGLLPTADPFALLRRVEAVHRAYWGLLDGLEEVARA